VAAVIDTRLPILKYALAAAEAAKERPDLYEPAKQDVARRPIAGRSTKGSEVRIGDLRKRAPGWKWSAVRSGFGYEYRGKRDGQTVRVYPVATLCGPAEDDYATVWRADDGASSTSVGIWLLSQNGATAGATNTTRNHGTRRTPADEKP
jgi:hypothetical protein